MTALVREVFELPVSDDIVVENFSLVELSNVISAESIVVHQSVSYNHLAHIGSLRSYMHTQICTKFLVGSRDMALDASFGQLR